MSVTINGDTGVSKVQDGSIVQADLASGVAGTGPAFSAYLSSNQSITTSTYTKINLDTEVFDTNNNFASGRFTPAVAGYYQLTAAFIAFASGTSITVCQPIIYKNGSAHLLGVDPRGLTLTSTAGLVSGLVYLNGTTDYVELYAYVTATSPSILAGATGTYFQGALVRAA